jgi:uncharacterized caspase-like protein/formylglycine-generating enzyme required for sulfatase activity
MKLLILLFTVWLSIASPAHAQRNITVDKSVTVEKRVALVIGNAAYKDAPLKNPVNDAKDMAATLRRLGFDVIEKTNVSQKDINRAIAQFGEKLRADTVALFFYAGHGMQVRGKNYIIPVDAHITGEATVRAEAVDVDTVMDQLAVSPMNIVILDACRNNPFERKFRSTGGGLAQMDAPKGSLIAYATAPGKTAADGDSRNGLYTQELLKHIQTPGLPLEAVFKRVRNGVMAASGDAQTPWEASSLTGDFFFRPAAGVTVSTAMTPAPIDSGAMELSFWESIKSSGDAEDFQAYLDKYPSGQFVALAERRVKRKPVKADEPTTGAGTPAVPGTIIKNCADCPEMVVLPTGIAMGKTEVTQGQWKAIMGNNPSKFINCGDTCPVEQVSWYDAQAFIQKLNQKTGKEYRLPTEAEWEYACYGGNQSEYCGGNDHDAVGWAGSPFSGSTHPAGQKQSNGYGLYDMSGNVWEWTNDCGSEDCARRVLRGGSWHNTLAARAVQRISYKPAVRDSNYGFRLARTLGQEFAQPITTARREAAESERQGATGALEWANSDNGADINWNEATHYCASKGSGWRLPTSAELLASYQSGHSTPCGKWTCNISSNSRLTGPAFWTNERDDHSEALAVSLYVGKKGGAPVQERTLKRALCLRQP